MPAPDDRAVSYSMKGIPLLAGAPRIAVIIVNYRTAELTLRCLAALAEERDELPGLKAVIVDGGSGDGSADKLREALALEDYRNWVSLIPLQLNGGFGWANNQAILTLARQPNPPDFVHLLNPDTEVRPGAVARLAEELRAEPRCGAVGSQLLTPEGAPAASAFRFPSAGREFIGAAQSEKLGRIFAIRSTVVRSEESVEVDWVTGASVMFRAEALKDSRLFDDGFFLYFEEVELMHRMRAHNWTVRHVPASRVTHIEGASTGVGATAAVRPLPDYWYRSRRRYFGLTGSRGALVASNIAWFAGNAIAQLRTLGGRTQMNNRVRIRDLLRSSRTPTHADQNSSAPSWGDPPGKLPAWMAEQ